MRRPFTPFCFPFFSKVFVLVPVCLSRGKEVAARNPAIAHCKRAWEFGGIAASAASPLAASPHARRSREISAAGGGSPSSRVAAPPGAPFAGDHTTSDSVPAGPPLTQCPPARLRLIARRPASDSMPAGSPLTQARRIAADSSPPDWR